MNIKILCGALVLGLSAIAASGPAMGQSGDKGASAPTDSGASATKDKAKKAAATNTNTNPTKHRHWRHRGGKHPHYGSRRVRT